MISYVLTCVLSVISGILVFWVNELIKENKRLKDTKKESQQAISDGVLSLLKIQLIEYHDKYMTKEKIPTYVYDNFDEMYKAYAALGGNGMVKRMKEDIDKLRLGGIRNEES